MLDDGRGAGTRSVTSLLIGSVYARGLPRAADLVPLHPHHGPRFDCQPGPLRPLAANPTDLALLPIRALIFAPIGLYLSGLEVAVAAYPLALLPAWSLPQGTARRWLGFPLVVVLAVVMLVCGWTAEVAAVRAHGLPPIACW